MIVFIFVVVISCMSLAAGFYVGVMLLIWAVSLRARNVGLRRVFLPSPEQFRDNAAEYVLALVTSVLLAVTTVAKHDLVQQIRAWPAADLPGLANLFPLHTVPGRLPTSPARSPSSRCSSRRSTPARATASGCWWRG